MLLIRYVMAVFGEIQGGICFTVFAIAVGKLAYEMGFITPLGLPQVQADGTGRTTNLAGKRVPFFRRKPFAKLENAHGQRVRFLIYFHVLGRIKSHSCLRLVPAC